MHILIASNEHLIFPKLDTTDTPMQVQVSILSKGTAVNLRKMKICPMGIYIIVAGVLHSPMRVVYVWCRGFYMGIFMGNKFYTDRKYCIPMVYL